VPFPEVWTIPRRLRLHAPGGFYHVTLRGNHRQPIFFVDGDRDLLDIVVTDAIDQLTARVHAYCWMTNHLHLLVQISDVPLGRLVMRIASLYARIVQARLDTTGHLFERRYHAVLVDADAYLLTLVRYIHLNPVRAGLVADPAAYPWSSHRVYLGACQRPWVTTGFTLRMLAEQPAKAAAKYREFMNNSEPCRWGTGILTPHCDQPQVLGDDKFVARLKNAAYQPRSRKSLDDLIRACSERYQLTPESLVSTSRAHHLARARAWIGHEAVAGRVASICEVARRLGRSEGAIRHLMKRHPPTATDQ
jgi:REP element-mobilizing transposase RayT